MKKIFCLLFFGLMAGGTVAQMNKCAPPEGGIIFSDRPCPAGTTGESVLLPEQASTSDRSQNEVSSAGEYYERLTNERRSREIDFEIEKKQRRIDENLDRLTRELSELQERVEALSYVRRDPPGRKQQSAVIRFHSNALAQQGVRNQIQTVVTICQTENTVLDDRITQLHTEKAALNSARPAEKSPRDLNEQYEKISRERRLREIDFEIDLKQREIDGNDDGMNHEMAELQRKMDAFGDNPLNESGRQSLYISMQAATSKYQLRSTALDRQIARLRAEKSRL